MLLIARKGNPDGSLSTYPSLRILWLEGLFRQAETETWVSVSFLDVKRKNNRESDDPAEQDLSPGGVTAMPNHRLLSSISRRIISSVFSLEQVASEQAKAAIKSRNASVMVASATCTLQ